MRASFAIVTTCPSSFSMSSSARRPPRKLKTSSTMSWNACALASRSVSPSVEWQRPRRVGKAEQLASRRFHRLQLAGVDSVQARAQRLFVERHRAAAFEALLFANLADLAAAEHDPIVRTGEAVNGNTFFHRKNSLIETFRV